MVTFLFKKLILVQRAFAEGQGQIYGPTLPDGEGLPNALKYDTIEEVLNAVWGYLVAISVPLVAIMVIIGAFQIMFAGGNEERVTTGKKTVLYAVVGFAIVLLAGGIVLVINELLGVQ